MQDNYLEINVEGTVLEPDIENTTIAISWALESTEDFTRKKGSEALDIETWLNNRNSKTANTLHDPASIDMTAGEQFEKPRPATIKANGYEFLVGKALLKGITHNVQPIKARWNFYGENSDWAIDMKEVTLQQCVNPRPMVFNHAVVEDSWSFDGRDEAKDFVFALARYSRPFAANTDYKPDEVVTIYDMRPAISIYYLLYRGFNSIGYRLNSQFLDSDYFRRQVLPWTWGSFLRLDNSVYDTYKFAANTPEANRETGDCVQNNTDFDRYVNLKASNDSTDGMFDNGYVYTWNDTQARMIYTYPSSAPSKVVAGFKLELFLNWVVTANSDIAIWAEWYVNGTRKQNIQLKSLNAPAIGRRDYFGNVEDTFEWELTPGDVVDCRLFMRTKKSGLGKLESNQYVTAFELKYFKLAVNSTISLTQYNKFSNYKLLDLLNGLKQLFDFQFSTDNIKKVVTIEPMFEVPESEGFIKSNAVDYSGKQDLSKDSNLEIYSDYEREWTFAFKEDSADGAVKKMQDRFNTTVGKAKYLLPERYKQGRKEIRNSFFAPLMHVQAQQFGSITGIVPQVPCIYPENISNTSSTESENTFEPKIAYYKGNVTGVGGWKWLNASGTVENKTTLPYMFSVNYQPGGEEDPVLTYADQAIPDGSGGSVLATGLLRKHFLRRMAIYRHGRYYQTWAWFKPSEVNGNNFRNVIKIGISLWVLVEVNGYEPLKEESAGIVLWKWHPITAMDNANTFPSNDAVINDTSVSPFDLKYIRHIILYSDLPK